MERYLLVTVDGTVHHNKPKGDKLGVKEACKTIKAEGLEVVKIGDLIILLDILGKSKELPPNILVSLFINSQTNKEVITFGDAIITDSNLFDDSVSSDEFEVIRNIKPRELMN